MANLLSPTHWAQAAREARDGPYVDGARARQPWLKLLLFVLLAAAFLVVVAAGSSVVAAVGYERGWLDIGMFEDGFRASSLAEESTFLAILAGFLFALAMAVLLAAMIVYQRRIGAFLWPAPGGSLALFLSGFAVMFLIALVLWPIANWMEPGGPGPLLDPAEPLDARLTYAGAAAAGLLIAAAAEEIAFRGVLLRVTGSLTRSLIVILLANGVLFSAIHLDPDPVAFTARAASGMVWAWAALRLGNLAFAIGAHLANNLFIALLQAPISEAAIPGQNIPLEALGLQAVSLIVVLLAVEVLAQRRARLS